MTTWPYSEERASEFEANLAPATVKQIRYIMRLSANRTDELNDILLSISNPAPELDSLTLGRASYVIQCLTGYIQPIADVARSENLDGASRKVSKTVEEACAEWWSADGSGDASLATRAFKAGVAWKEAQDLAHVEAVRASFDDEQPFDWIAARITAEEPGKGEG